MPLLVVYAEEGDAGDLALASHSGQEPDGLRDGLLLMSGSEGAQEPVWAMLSHRLGAGSSDEGKRKRPKWRRSPRWPSSKRKRGGTVMARHRGGEKCVVLQTVVVVVSE